MLKVAERVITKLNQINKETMKTAPKNNLKEGKPRASLIPWDILIEYLVPTYEEGVHKYKRESWRDGFNISVLYDALQRHLIAFFYKHEDIDPEITKPGLKAYHLGAAMFCILSMIWTLKTRPELDDRPTHNIPVLEDEIIPRDPVKVYQQWADSKKGK